MNAYFVFLQHIFLSTLTLNSISFKMTYYNYETQENLLTITKIAFKISKSEIDIMNNDLKHNKPNPLTGYAKPYLSSILPTDLENFKMLFNLETIEITLFDAGSDSLKNSNEYINQYTPQIEEIQKYFESLGEIETVIYNLFDEQLTQFHIGSVATPYFNSKIQEYVYNIYNVIIYNLNEFNKFLNDYKTKNNNCPALYDYRYSQLLNYIKILEKRIEDLENNK